MEKLLGSTFGFLKLIESNNNREWFLANKDQYLKQQASVERFIQALLADLQKHDVLETKNAKQSMHRIYRDTRFSKDKSPYKTYWGGGFKRASKFRRGGYYYHIEPGNSYVVGGFWGPVPADLKLIRDEIAFDASPLQKVLSDKDFVDNFGLLQGEQLKKAPKGYDANHEGADLLKFKQFLLKKSFSDEEVLSAEFKARIDQTYRAMRPFFDYMSQVLCSDGNGYFEI